MPDPSEAILDILENLAHENPPPEERWFTEDDIDPPFLRRDLRAAAKAKLIEIAEMVGDLVAEPLRFRLTSLGRAMLKNSLLQALNKEDPDA